MFSLEREKGQHFKIPLQIHSNTRTILMYYKSSQSATNIINMVDK